MASLNVPREIIAIIASLSDTETLKALRLTNHMLCAFATKSVFSTVSLYTDDKSCEAFESVITHPQLKEYVHKVRLNTVEVDFVSDISNRGGAICTRRTFDSWLICLTLGIRRRAQ